MNCNQANEISIVDFLSSHGIEPVKTRGKDVWYLSPLRIEKSASFKVDTSLNRWFDFGIAKGGKLVDLATQLLNVSIEELLGRLAGSHFERVPLVSMVKDKEQDSVRLLSIKKLEHRLLIKYLIERGINVTIATEHCFEISYATEARNYFGIGFRNDVNGFEARNKYFKGSDFQTIDFEASERSIVSISAYLDKKDSELTIRCHDHEWGSDNEIANSRTKYFKISLSK